MTHHVEGALEGSLLREQTQENRFNYLTRAADSSKEDAVSTKGQIIGALWYLGVENIQICHLSDVLRILIDVFCFVSLDRERLFNT